MLVFVVPSKYPNRFNKQANIFVHEQCLALQKMGYKIIVLDAGAYNYKKWLTKEAWKPVKRNYEGIDVFSFNTKCFLSTLLPRLYLFYYKRHLNKLFKIAKKEYGKPKCVYAHFSEPSGYSCINFCKEEKIPLIIAEHGGIYLDGALRRYDKKILVSSLKSASAFLCVSDIQKKHISNYCSSLNIHVVNNMISNLFTYHESVKKESFYFFSAGNLLPVKNFDLLINAFASVYTTNKKIKLRIAGAGPQSKELKTLIEGKGLQGEIELIGRLTKKEMLSEYINCDSFILLSKHESFGIAFREALAVGRPVISSNNGGILQGWNNECGFIINDLSLSNISKAMLEMIANYHKFDLMKISSECLNNFSERNVMQNISDILTESVESELNEK